MGKVSGWLDFDPREVNERGWGGLQSTLSSICKSTFHHSDVYCRVTCTHVLMMCCVVWCSLSSVYILKEEARRSKRRAAITQGKHYITAIARAYLDGMFDSSEDDYKCVCVIVEDLTLHFFSTFTENLELAMQVSGWGAL